jgi:hypothetical protein
MNEQDVHVLDMNPGVAFGRTWSMRKRSWLAVGFWFILAVGILPGCGKPNPANNVISGKVILNDKPVTFATIFAIGPDNSEVSGLVENGAYRIAQPPVGELRFKVIAGVPPPPPGRGVPAAAPPGAVIPPRYQTPSSGLALSYRGGKQTYDITMTR